MADVPYIEHNELKALIKDKTKVPGKDYLVIDVRDDDYEVSFFNFFV